MRETTNHARQRAGMAMFTIEGHMIRPGNAPSASVNHVQHSYRATLSTHIIRHDSCCDSCCKHSLSTGNIASRRCFFSIARATRTMATESPIPTSNSMISEIVCHPRCLNFHVLLTIHRPAQSLRVYWYHLSSVIQNG